MCLSRSPQRCYVESQKVSDRLGVPAAWYIVPLGAATVCFGQLLLSCLTLESIFNMASISASTILAGISVSLAGIVISSFFYRIFLQYWNLRHIPGPFAARFTNFWLISKYWNKENFSDIAVDLGKKYGPVVRYGPDRVLFSDPSAVSVIFSTRNPLRKVIQKINSSFART